MAPAGLVIKVLSAVESISTGRKGLDTDGEEHSGRIFYEGGLVRAAAAFTEALSSADPLTLMLAETVFLEQELQFCDEADTNARGSLKAAIQSFYDARRSLEAVEDAAGYKTAEKTWPTNSKNRIRNFPKDAFHQACIAHRTRLRNILHSPGINMKEKAILERRAANMNAAQTAYIEKQKTVLGR